MAEENKQAEESEDPVTNIIFYGPQFLYEILYKHKKELGLPENFKIGGGKKFKDVLYALRKQAYNQFKTTYKTPHLNQPKMEVQGADKEIEALKDIIEYKKDKIWELMEKDESLRTYNYGGKTKIKISNKKDFDILLKTPNVFIKVVKHDEIYNFKKTTQNIKDLEADLKYFEDKNAEHKKNLVQNGILKGNETDEEINNKLKEINKRLQQLRPKHNHNTATKEEEAEYNLLDDAKDKINDLKQNRKYITKDKEEINKASEYNKGLEGKYNEYIKNKDITKQIIKDYKRKLKEEKVKSEKEYNEKLKTIEENAKLTAKEKDEKIKELEDTKDKLDEAYYAKLVELEENKHNIDFLEKKVKDKENIITDKEKEIEDGKKAVAYQTAKRHEAEVKAKHARDELKNKEEQQKTTYQPSNTPPTLKDYIKDKIINKSYSLEKDELIKVIEKDINEHKLPKDIDVSKLADTIYLQGAKYINKHMKKIKSLVKLTGYDNDLYNKLPPELAGEIQKYIHDKALEDIRNKNIRYILPKEMPRWEKAVNKGINPMLGRGAWSK